MIHTKMGVCLFSDMKFFNYSFFLRYESLLFQSEKEVTIEIKIPLLVRGLIRSTVSELPKIHNFPRGGSIKIARPGSTESEPFRHQNRKTNISDKFITSLSFFFQDRNAKILRPSARSRKPRRCIETCTRGSWSAAERPLFQPLTSPFRSPPWGNVVAADERNGHKLFTDKPSFWTSDRIR